MGGAIEYIFLKLKMVVGYMFKVDYDTYYLFTV
jgi:hypothetical protein